MTATATPPAQVPRDRWKRPLILPLDGGDPTPYARVSTMAKALDDLTGLMAWQNRKVLEGVLRRPDLLTDAAGILANGDPDTDWPTKRGLNDVATRAREAAGSSKGSTAGTGLHALTEAIDRGEEPLFVPDSDRPRLAAYTEATAGYTALDMETFVVCDELRAAGSFDRLWLCPDGRVRVGDLKTGKSEADYPLATTMQIATYAHGSRYDPETGARTPLHDDLDLTTGLLVHMPPSGGCKVIPLDLDRGWQAARLAAEVHHTVRRWKPADLVRGATT